MEVYTTWTAEVETVTKINLGKPLLTRNSETLQLAVNFDLKVQ